MTDRLVDEWAAFLAAARFLTRLPLPSGGHDPAAMAASPAWYPAVGALVGTLAAAVFWLAALVFPAVLAALLSTAAGLLVTGCLHEDGLADVCDGLGGGATRERALEIMRDSRIGVFGAAGLGTVLAAKVLALAALPAAAVPLALVAGHAASRGSMVVVIVSSTYVRGEGAATPMSGGLDRAGLALALATGGMAIAAATAVLPVVAVAGGVVGLAAGYGVMRWRFERRLGGYTGDCLGAVQQASELGFYLGLLACL